MKKTKMKINTNSLDPNASDYIKTTLIVFAVFALVYALVTVLSKTGLFEKGYEAPELEAAVISDEYILAGTIFNKLDEEYYVVFDNFSSKNSDVYLKYILDSTTSDLPIYKVDMSLGVHDKLYNENSNSKVQKSLDLKIKGVTLMKVKKGKNVLYLEDLDKIKSELIF